MASQFCWCFGIWALNTMPLSLSFCNIAQQQIWLCNWQTTVESMLSCSRSKAGDFNKRRSLRLGNRQSYKYRCSFHMFTTPVFGLLSHMITVSLKSSWVALRNNGQKRVFVESSGATHLRKVGTGPCVGTVETSFWTLWEECSHSWLPDWLLCCIFHFHVFSCWEVWSTGRPV